MAAALFRRGAGLCCIHRELCRAVWRPQTALFSSKPPDIKQPRWTHIKKAKPQPAVDVATLLEQLFPHHRPGTAPPVARPAEASFMPNKPPIASSVKVSASNVPPLSKTEPEASVSPAASSLKQVDARRLSNVTVPTTSGSSSTSATSASLASEVAAIECQTLMETIETKVETATEPVELKTATALPLSDRMVEEIAETSSSPAATVEPLIETTIESPVEHIVSSVVVEGPVEPTVEAPAEEVQTKVTDSGVVDVLHAAEEPLIETTIESPVEGSNSPVETHETRAAVVEGPVDVTAQKVETKSTDSGVVDISHITTVEPLIETTIEPAVEKSISLLEALEDRSAVAEGSVETTLEAEAVTAALSVQTNSTDSVPLSLSHAAEAEPLIETTIESQVDVTVGTLETRAAVVEGPVEPTIDVTVDVAAHTVETTSTDSGDLQELEGESGMLVKELLCHIPPKTPDSVKTSSAYDPAEAMTLESMTLAEVKEEVGALETEVLLETRNALEEEANVLAKEEKMEVVTVMDDDVFEETPEAEFLTLDSISEAADAIEAETAVVLEAMLGSGQDAAVREAEKESVEKQDGVLEAMSLESVTLAEVEASLGTLENEPLSETINYLETEAEVVAGEKKTEVEVEDVDASGETTDGLFLAEVDALPEDLQIDAVMEELLFSVPAPVTVVTGGLIDREIVKADSLDATVATGSVDVDTAAAVTDDPPASPALKEVLMEEEEEEKEGAKDEALENEDGKGTHADLDPVQRLFLEKIKEYNNMRRLNGGLMEAEPDYEKHLSEETAKLQRLYGGGDLSSFPQFTFTEPQLDQDSK
ncbi:mucin-22-like [Anoplopoma fimbria]|uniref:mucin-22-like n=1 Tax=Anoplopoma fimbria TaxID=229290 RepID=UPI0023EC5678|nr:mucin-22-like [Anoplopoma fimbria]